MSTPASDADVFRAVLREHAAERAGEHPGDDALVAYLTGELDGEAEARVNDHLVACRACASRLLDLEPLTRPDAAPDDGVVDLAAAAAWRDLRRTVFEAPEDRPVVAGPAGAQPIAGRPWWTAVAASLLVATGMSVWVARLSGTADDLRERVAELSRPVPNPPVFHLFEGTRSADPEAFVVPAGAPRFHLSFTLTGSESYDEYEIRFFDPEGAEVLHVPGLRPNESRSLRLELARGWLPAAEYRILINGFDGDRWREVGEFRRWIGEAAPGPG